MSLIEELKGKPACGGGAFLGPFESYVLSIAGSAELIGNVDVVYFH